MSECGPHKTSNKPHFSGHRERLRERFRKGGSDALPDYELLELILFRALPRRDTKPLAKALLEKFGSFADVLNAPVERLGEVNGIGEQVITEIKLIAAAANRLGQSELANRPIFSSWDKLMEYCHAVMAYETKGLLIGESASPELGQGVRAIVKRSRDVRHVNELRSMHMAPNDILLALSLDFHDDLSSGRVEETIFQLEQDIKSRFPDIKRLYIEVQSQRDHDRVAATERRAERAAAKDD